MTIQIYWPKGLCLHFNRQHDCITNTRDSNTNKSKVLNSKICKRIPLEVLQSCENGKKITQLLKSITKKKTILLFCVDHIFRRNPNQKDVFEPIERLVYDM